MLKGFLDCFFFVLFCLRKSYLKAMLLKKKKKNSRLKIYAEAFYLIGDLKTVKYPSWSLVFIRPIS